LVSAGKLQRNGQQISQGKGQGKVKKYRWVKKRLCLSRVSKKPMFPEIVDDDIRIAESLWLYPCVSRVSDTEATKDLVEEICMICKELNLISTP
jgi:hypothetical protein